jgi:hypothetical protein
MAEALALMAVEVGGWFAMESALGAAATELAGAGIVGAGMELSAAEAAAMIAGGAGAGTGAAALGGAAATDAAAAGAGLGMAEATGGLMGGGMELVGPAMGAGVEAGGAAAAGGGALANLTPMLAGEFGPAASNATGLAGVFGEHGATLSKLFAKGGMGQNALQMASGLYSLNNAMQASKLARRPDKMGRQAIMRSMAAQGYQGSGNMAAALGRHGAYDSLRQSQAMGGPLNDVMSSLGLISGGISGLAGNMGG